MSMEIQDPQSKSSTKSNSNSNADPNPQNAAAPKHHHQPPSSNSPSPSPSASSSMLNARSGPYHRRAQSEVSFRLPEDMTMMMMDPAPSNPINCNSNGNGNGNGNGGSSTCSLEEIGSEDDLFSAYIDMDKLNGGGGEGRNCTEQGHNNNDDNNEGEKEGGRGGGSSSTSRPKHRHSNSVDGSVHGEVMEAKKAMPPDKLAELWTIDPKRAKRSIVSLSLIIPFYFPFHLQLLSCLDSTRRFVHGAICVYKY